MPGKGSKAKAKARRRAKGQAVSDVLLSKAQIEVLLVHALSFDKTIACRK